MEGTLKGRIVYLEPNDFVNQIGPSFGSGDNVYWKPEDLNISVDLQVIVPDRNGNNENIFDSIDVTVNKNSNWTSFFRGTELDKGKPYLTDSYTDISYQEITQNHAGSREALGIKSIDIQFDSHFYPVVKMRMIDVRGASLMMPAEFNRENEEAINNKDISKRIAACQQFFSALFHFPYPRFALSVKGFYGSRVTFMLAVNDFQSSFNSQTGNFEVEVSFIGHMYGLYTDIPMSCLLIAPYIDAGGDTVSPYWRTQTSQGGAFFFKDGSQIPTFKKFFEICQKLPDKFKEIYGEEGESFPSLNQVESLRNETSALKKILSDYDEIIKDIETKNSSNDSKIFSAPDFKIYFVNSKTFILPNIEEFEKSFASYLDIKTTETPISKPKGFEEPDKLAWGSSAIETFDPIVTSVKAEDGTTTYIVDTNHQLYSRISNIEEAIKHSDYADKRVYYVELDNEFRNSILMRCSEIENEISRMLGESSEELNDLTKKLLGFTPSIENIIRMTFAHIDAFMYEYYKVLDNIKKKSAERKRSNFKGIDKIYDDIDSNGGNYTYPPFPGFYEDSESNGERVRRYPGSIPQLSKLDEVNFIERIYIAIEAANGDIVEMQQNNGGSASEETPTTETKEEWMPLSVLDALEKENPYKKFSVPAGKKYSNELLKFIWARFTDACVATKAYLKDGIVNFPVESEVENFWNVQGKGLVNASNDFINELKQDIGEIIGNNSEETILKIINTLNNSKFTKDTIFTLGPKIGHYIVPEENEYLLKKMATRPLTYDYSSKWDYKVDKYFLSNIYREDSFDKDNICKQKNINDVRKEWTENAAIENSEHGQYMFPILQFYDSSYFPHDYFSEKEKDTPFNSLINNSTFLASFLGTNNIYRFAKNNSSIRRIPKVFALHIGERVSNGGDDATFIVNNEGYFEIDSSKWIKKDSNGFTVAELKERDKNGGLASFYRKWVSEEGVHYYRKLSNESYKTEFTFNTRYKDFSKKKKGKDTEGELKIPQCATNRFAANQTEYNEYTKKMVDLASSMVTILNVNDANDSIKTPFKNITAFFKLLLERINREKNSNNVEDTASEGNTDATANAKESGHAKVEAKEQLYYTLKNLYDKWLSCYNRDRFKLNTPETDSEIAYKKNDGQSISGTKVSEVQCFMYVDTFYNDIGSKLLVSPYIVSNMIADMGSRSVIQFISDIAEKSKLLFVALPVFSNMYDAKSIASIFTPQTPYGNNGYEMGWDNARGIGNTYVLMYTHQPSHFSESKRNENTTEYKKDQLSFIEPQLVTLNEAKKPGENYNIPAFGVTFGKQNQLYFKNINVNMANPRETDVSIANAFILADNERKGDSVLAPTTVGQDLYSIYSNRSYECSVDMMGCANIMPLMYFQLNNIPLFNGAYIIYGVKHHIENGSMSTSFTGIRVSQNAIPMNANVIDVEALLTNIRRGESSINNDAANRNTESGGSVGIGESKTSARDENGNSLPDSATFPLTKNPNLPEFSIPKVIEKFNSGIYVPWLSKTVYPYTNVNFAQNNKACAQCTKEAMRAGFSNGEQASKIGTCNGYECATKMDGWDFQKVLEIASNASIVKFKGPFEPGDVCCSTRPGAKYGHIAIFDGTHFVSDSVQVSGVCANGSSGSKTSHYLLYRYKGPIIYPSDYLIISFNISENIEVRISTEGWATDGDIVENGQNIVVKNPNKSDNNCKLYYKAKIKNPGNKDEIKAEVVTYYDKEDKSKKSLSDAIVKPSNKEDKKTNVMVSLCNVKDKLGMKAVISFSIS